MKTMRGARKTMIDDAVAALQPFYEPGDDGYPVKLALNALAGVLTEKADLDVKAEDGLIDLLEWLKAPAEIRTSVEELYKNAAGGEYGLGLSKRQARAINDLVQEVVDELVDYIQNFVPRRRSRTGTRSRRATRPRSR